MKVKLVNPMSRFLAKINLRRIWKLKAIERSLLHEDLSLYEIGKKYHIEEEEVERILVGL